MRSSMPLVTILVLTLWLAVATQAQITSNPIPAPVTYHNVITEWHATNPAANTFEGTRRELPREAHVVEFNPTER